MLYAVAQVNYDVIHIQHKPIAERICQLYPDIPKVYTVHSEVISLEEPIIHPSIKKYISIRESISEYINKTINIAIEDISVIYNPIDENRFNIVKSTNENYVLFVGTIDYLREKTIRDLVLYTKEKNLELWLVGDSSSNYLSELLTESHVKHFKSTWNVEKYTKKCVETAGIMLGRTTIEGWMCGKPSWIYKVDSGGVILSKEKFNPPTDIEKYYTLNVAQKIKDEYIKIL
jgi:glycosyltransferase involved in cell wall biosynthesis